MELARRGFLKVVGLSSLAVLLSIPGAKLLAGGKKMAIPLDKAEKLQKVDGWAILQIGDVKVLFVRDSETTVAAASPICTHEKCELFYTAKTKTLDCPCHKSKFDLKGKHLGGPAPKDLPIYNATLDLQKNRIIIEL